MKLFRENNLLKNFSVKFFQLLNKFKIEKKFGKGTVLLEVGEIPAGFFIVKKGSFGVEMPKKRKEAKQVETREGRLWFEKKHPLESKNLVGEPLFLEVRNFLDFYRISSPSPSDLILSSFHHPPS